MLLLTSIEIENFRGIRQGKLEGLTDVNILIGRNNCGKTTVIEAIHRSIAGQDKVDRLRQNIVNYWTDVRRDGSPHDAAYQKCIPAKVTVRCTLTGYSKGSASEINRMLLYSMFSDNGDSLAKEQENSILIFRSQVMLFRPPDALTHNIEQLLWTNILADRSDKELVKSLNEIFSVRAESFSMIDSKLYILFEKQGIPLDSQGDGTRAAVRTLMMLALVKDSIFLLEEPECHQHPGSLERFAIAVCKLAKANQVQLILSTHSNECVRAFMKASNQVESNAAVFHLALTDGLQTARRLDTEAVETLTDTGIDIRFLDMYS